jgi:hypothetical protein
MPWWKLILRCEKLHKENPGMRFGQIFFNELSIHRPELADKIRGSKDDPFYKSDKAECDLSNIQILFEEKE